MDLQNTPFTVTLESGVNVFLANADINTDNIGTTIQFYSVDFLDIDVVVATEANMRSSQEASSC